MFEKLLTRLNPMPLLLMKEGYPPAVVFALLLHGALLYFMLDRELAPRDSIDLEQANYVTAMTIDQNPQRLRRIEQEQARAQEAARRREQREREEQAAREAEARREAEAERQRQQEAERRRQEEAERQRREEAERRAREEAEREQARREQEAREREAREQAAREAEAARQRAAQQAAAEQAAADNQAIQAYTGIIRQAIARNWSIPPSARNGMSVLINIRLVPTGEVISVNVIESSGDPAFDRSAEQAVLKAERFPELQQMPTRLFERQFRSFNLLFRPEDLLR